MTLKKGKERLVSDDEIKLAADKAEQRSSGLPVESDVARPETRCDPLNPPESKLGRPTGYKPEYTEIAKSLCLRGFTDEEIADTFSITVRTLYRWRAKYPDFCQSMVTGKDSPDDRVERSLYQRAIGYSYDAEKVTKLGEVVTYKVHVPPDPTSLKFWLMNRRSDKWRERKELEVGRPGQFDQMAHEELIASLREDMIEFGGALLEQLPDDDKKKLTRIKGNDTTH